MATDTTSQDKRAVAKAANFSFSAVSVIVLLAFMGGTMFGKAAHQMFVTMFSPDVVVLPNTNK